LRILFLCSATETVGTYWRAFFLAKHLIEEGHKVLLIAADSKPGLNASKKVIDGVNVYLLPSATFGGNLLLYSLSEISTVFMQTPLNCILELASDFDVFHSFDVMGPHNAAPTLLFKTLRILRLHNKKIFVDWDEWWGRGGMYGLKLLGLHGGTPLDLLTVPIVTILEEKVPLCADAVTVINETLRQRALSVGVKSENLFVISSGANVDIIKPLNMYDARQKLNLPEKNIIYGHFGHMDLESFKLLILSHKKVLRYFPNASLLLFRLGQDLLTRLSKDLVKSLKRRNVLFVGQQPYDKYILYLGASDVFLLPMLDNMFNRARWPLRLGDYLAAGRPIVATALPEIEKVVGKCGFLSKPGNPEDFANKILEIIRDADLRKQMGKRARELAEKKYSWRILARKLLNAYRQYLN